MSCNAIQYKIGTSLQLSITANSSDANFFTGATVTFNLYQNSNSRSNPLFSKPWSTHESAIKTNLVLIPTELTLGVGSYQASLVIVKNATTVTIEDFKFKILLFADDAQEYDQNLILGSQNSGLIFNLEASSNGVNSVTRVYNQNLTSQINNLTNIFTLPFPFISGSEDVKLNGMTQTLIDDYIVTNSTTIQLVSIPTTNDHLSISYNKA